MQIHVSASSRAISILVLQRKELLSPNLFERCAGACSVTGEERPSNHCDPTGPTPVRQVRAFLAVAERSTLCRTGPSTFRRSPPATL